MFSTLKPGATLLLCAFALFRNALLPAQAAKTVLPAFTNGVYPTGQNAVSGDAVMPSLISGFGAGWTLNDNGVAPASITGGTLQITPDGFNYCANSAFYSTPQDIRAFTVSFTYQMTYDPNDSIGSPADGSVFVLQNDSRGLGALGYAGSDLGYTDEQGGSVAPISPSVGIPLNVFSGFHVPGTNLLYNGQNPGFIYADISPVNLDSQHAIDVFLTYDGSILQETLTDETTGDTYSTSYNVNIPAIVGGNTAYVGFTGATGGGMSAQSFSNFNFSSSNVGLKLTPLETRGGSKVKGTITLSSPAASLMTIPLSSSNTSLATVPAIVKIAKGRTSTSFTVTTQPVTSQSTVTISAAVGSSTLSGNLTLDPPRSLHLQISATVLASNNFTFGTVTVDTPAPYGGIPINLSQNPGGTLEFYDMEGFLTSIIVIPAGSNQVQFKIVANQVAQNTIVTVAAASGGVKTAKKITIVP